MPSGVHYWSSSAANNASADSAVNWAEGQAPSSVNDSARAMMASVANWRNDTSGFITTTGTSTAYAVTSNQGFASLAVMGYAVIAFVPHVTSGAAPTLSVDGLAAQKIRFTTGADLPTNSLIAGTPYVVTYYAATTEFLVHNIGSNPYQVPLGAGFDFWGATAPNTAFALGYGQALSRTLYSGLFGIFGTTYGSGDGSTTFNIPDKRGRVSAGLDNMGGSAAGRLTGAWMSPNGNTLGAFGGAQDIALTENNNGPHIHSNSVTDPGHAHNFSSVAFGGLNSSVGGSSLPRDASTGVTTTNVTGISVSISSSGLGTAHNNVQPTIMCNYLIRVL